MSVLLVGLSKHKATSQKNTLKYFRETLLSVSDDKSLQNHMFNLFNVHTTNLSMCCVDGTTFGRWKCFRHRRMKMNRMITRYLHKSHCIIIVIQMEHNELLPPFQL